jgi:hypothetical protein
LIPLRNAPWSAVEGAAGHGERPVIIGQARGARRPRDVDVHAAKMIDLIPPNSKRGADAHQRKSSRLSSFIGDLISVEPKMHRRFFWFTGELLVQIRCKQ